MSEPLISLTITDDILGEVETFKRAPLTEGLRGKKNYKTLPKKKARKARRLAALRAEHGVTPYDFWDFCSRGAMIFAAALRNIDTTHSRNLLHHLIELHDADMGNSYTYYADPNKQKIEQERWTVEAAEKKTSATSEWLTLWNSVAAESPQIALPASGYAFDIAAAESITSRFNTPWAEWRGIFTDPTSEYVSQLTSKEQTKHARQRVIYGYSDIDMRVAPMQYVSWVYANALTWFASAASISHIPELTYDKAGASWASKVPAFIHLTYNPTLEGLDEATKSYVEKTLASMPTWINDLWD